MLEEQKYDAAEDEAAEKESDEGKPLGTDPSAKDENLDEKPDINDVPMDENEVKYFSNGWTFPFFLAFSFCQKHCLISTTSFMLCFL